MAKKNTSNGSTAATIAGPELTLSAAEGEGTEEKIGAASDQEKASIFDLLDIARDAVNIRPPLWVSSVLGRPWTWIPPYRRFSEFRILNLWRPVRTFKYLVDVTVPSIPRTPPPFGPPPLNNLFWQPSVILQRPDHNGSYTTFPEEAWFFLNGIMTNDALAQVNAAYISYLFHRPVTLIQNSTDSFAIDMLQCMVGKEWAQVTEPVVKAFPAIYDALKDTHKDRVIVIAHSQGTIIISNVLRLLYQKVQRPREEALEMLEAAPEFAEPEFVYPDEFDIDLDDFDPLSLEELAKLEVYCFATCANVLDYYTVSGEKDPVPWIEHFGNEYDIVARLGMLAPNAEEQEIRIGGPRYMRRKAWGHFLNEHYLFAIADEQKVGRKKGGTGTAAPFELLDPSVTAADQVWPRLYDYLNGGSP